MSTHRTNYSNPSSSHIPYPSDSYDYESQYQLATEYPPMPPQPQTATPFHLQQHEALQSHPVTYPMATKGSETSISTRGSDLDDSSERQMHMRPIAIEEDVPRPSFFQSLLPQSLACRLYILIVLLETAVDIAIETDIFIRLGSVTSADAITVRRLPVYLAIFVFAHLFQLALAIDAVYHRNTLQFLFLAIFNALFLAYAIIQRAELHSAVEDLKATGISHIPISVLTTIIPVVISIAEVAYIALGWKIYTEFGWKVYKLLGADTRVKRMYMHFQIFECLIKFDVFFWVGFSVQFIWLVLNPNDFEYYVTIAALPLSILLLVEGQMAARHESKVMMGCFMAGCATALCYFVYKEQKILRNRTDFQSVVKSLSVFSFIAIAFLIMTVIWAYIVMSNFGKGLKFHMSKNKRASVVLPAFQREHHRRATSQFGAGMKNRMSIE